MGAISNDWLEPLSGEFKQPYYKHLYETIKKEYQTRVIYPDADDIFNAFWVRIRITGEGRPTGCAFP